MSTLLSSTRQRGIEKIAVRLELLVLHIKGENLSGRFDANSLSEDFFSDILNALLGLSLTNLNRTKKLNIKAIDLGDADNEICFQVTSENTRTKVKETVEGFVNDEGKTLYKKLRFIILDNKVARFKTDDLKRTGSFEFDPASDLLCIKDVLNLVEQADEATITYIDDYMSSRVPIFEAFIDSNIDEEILKVVNEIVFGKDFPLTKRNFDYLDVQDKISLNFKDEDDHRQITEEYERCLGRFNFIGQFLTAEGPDSEIILQSSMAELYNNLKRDQNIKTNIEIFANMVDRIEASMATTSRSATRRLAIKSLVLFHFEDCTIFEKTEKEKTKVASV